MMLKKIFSAIFLFLFCYTYTFCQSSKEETTKTIALSEIIIRGGSRIQQKGDTIIIKTADIKTRPHADATALFDKIAGLEVGFGGGVRILGKSVQEITIDGRRIFGGSPTITLQNLRSDMIQQMEFVEKTLANGQKTTQLNLTLKANRKNGTYGDIIGGEGNAKNYLFNGHFNKIGKNSFTNAFFTTNTINEQGIATKDIERLAFNSFRNSLNSTSSMIGLYDNQNNVIKIVDEQNFTKNLSGINTLISGGGNFTYTGEKSNYDVFIVFDKNTQQLNQAESRRTFLNENTQLLNDFQQQTNRLTNFAMALNGKTQLNDRIIITIANQFNVNQKNVVLTDTTISQFNQAPTNYFLYANRNTNSKEWSNNFQSSLTRKGRKKGLNSSVYFNFYHQSPIENNNFQNTYSPTNGLIRKDMNVNTFQLQAVQSVPLSKHFLLEMKVSDTYENYKINQKAFTAIENSLDSNMSGNSQFQNNKQEIGSYLLYQHPKWTIITGVSYWHWSSEREKNTTTSTYQQQLVWLPLAKINYRFSPKSAISLQYHTNFIVPPWKNLISIPDSSNLVNLSIGNIHLQPYIDRNIELTNNYVLKNGFQFNYTLNYHWYQNYIISESIIKDDTKSFVSSAFLNSNKQVRSWGLNFFALKIGTKNRLTWAMFGGFNHVDSYQKIDGQTLMLSSLTTDVFFASQSLKWNLIEKLSLQTDWKIQSYHTNSSTNWSNVFFAKSDYELGKNWFLNTTLKLIVSKNTLKQGSSQPFLDIGIDKYFFKNNGLCVSTIVKNTFNFHHETSISQTVNQQTILMTNYLPRVFLLKLTFYPESWK